MTEQDSTRARRERFYSAISYECEDCDVVIEGHSADVAEAPWLYCPDCNEEMDITVEK